MSWLKKYFPAKADRRRLAESLKADAVERKRAYSNRYGLVKVAILVPRSGPASAALQHPPSGKRRRPGRRERLIALIEALPAMLKRNDVFEYYKCTEQELKQLYMQLLIIRRQV